MKRKSEGTETNSNIRRSSRINSKIIPSRDETIIPKVRRPRGRPRKASIETSLGIDESKHSHVKASPEIITRSAQKFTKPVLNIDNSFHSCLEYSSSFQDLKSPKASVDISSSSGTVSDAKDILFPDNTPPLKTTPSFEEIVSGTTMNMADLSPRSLSAIVLKRAVSVQEIDDESWLTSTLMNLIITQFARNYENTCYFSVEFANLYKNNTDPINFDNITDILGNKILSPRLVKRPKSLIFFINAQNIHWNLIHVILNPEPKLHLYEPMGMPRHRRDGLNFRIVPKLIIDFLNQKFPLLDSSKSWIDLGYSVITKRHQLTSYDCGVACLLYAEKCGQGQVILKN